MKIKNLVAVLGLVSLATVANATPVNTSGSGSLQAGLDALTPGGFFDVNSDQIPVDEMWQINGSNASVSRLVFEFAGFEATSNFGIYDIYNPSNTLEIFSGSDCGTFDSTCTASGNLEVTQNIGGGFEFANLVGLNSATFSSSLFGYYLDASGETDPNGVGGFWYSESAKNSDGLDHMVAFQGDGVQPIDINGGTNYTPLGQNEYILAWEDMDNVNTPSPDRDYSDMVVLVESVSPVPEPATLVLFGLGLFGLGMGGRRRRNKI